MQPKLCAYKFYEKRPKSTLFNKYQLLFKMKNMEDDFHFECGLKIIKTIKLFLSHKIKVQVNYTN